MGAMVAEPQKMAKRKGRPKGERDDAPVKLDRKLVGMAKAIATARGVLVAEYLSTLTTGPIHRDYAKMLREVEAKGEDKP
jgi:hypothetical protein